MRDILFKAKRVDNGEWVEGSYVYTFGNNPLRPITNIVSDNYFIVAKNEGVFEIDKNTICQYTGLTDKNGRKIFEGDILNVIYSDQQGKCHYTENYILHDLRNTSVIGWLDYANELEIVGNEFDNNRDTDRSVTA